MGKLADIKTKETNESVEHFINSVQNAQQRDDCFAILKMMENATGDTPKMWGKSMIGFGNVRYKSPKTGREVEWFKIGFSPRKANLSLHLMKLDANLLKRLGKHKTGVGCLYINKLEDIDLEVLDKMIWSALADK